MLNIKYKKLNRSEFINEAVISRFTPITEKFPDLNKSSLMITIEMENSPLQPGPDLFKVKLQVKGGRYDRIIIEKENQNVYLAIADLSEHMLEILNRFGDKVRVKSRRKARELQNQINFKNNILNDYFDDT